MSDRFTALLNDCQDPITLAHSIVNARYDTAKDWHAAGGKVVGYLCDNVPIELITAAGFLPCRLGGTDLPKREKYAQLISTQGRVSGFGLSVAILESLLNSECDFVDHLVIPHNRKAIEATFGQLSRACARDADIKAPDTWLLDRTWLASGTSERFNTKQVLAFRAVLEEWRGKPITEEELQSACQTHSDNRQLISTLMQLRQQQPASLKGSDALAIIRAGQLIPAEDYNQLLKRVLEHATSLPPLSGPRVFLAGSPFDHNQLYQTIEQAGGIVVGEDHCWGMRCVEHELGNAGDVMQQICDRYDRTPGCSVTYPLQRNVDTCLLRAQASNAEAVIFAVMQGDETHLWTTVDEKKAAEQAGLTTLQVSELDYNVSTDAQAVVANFVRSLK
ncbi:2-hydroxyacyl-CoA dehydratase subunit D [Alteromonas lipolytica]|uniref:2-hydroxyglutaryl-CoA dehydratase n=1 Tax=Alteromonas lipolytica TaxID=1856405 RepID=A0A1E8FC59_9ALTE|nr:2-hydroxyacyl-CoA dehydratase family protein [Alteromonas lipolytica]OFI33500.1 hypothetical protein BFC17_04375 [Alteromonas lipolytica]GGF59105.1 3-hydroxyacyl-ACP dehydratase [Alteromonas lipolytica]